jgi:sugar phosphate isomerase/epimerase
MNSFFSRRDFLVTSALATGALTVGLPRSTAAEKTAPRFPLIGFSKPFQNLSPEQTAELGLKVGWEGFEIPVRAKGQIEPERVADELPKFAEIVRRAGLDIYIVATDITSPKTPHTETLLRTLSKLRIRRFRLGFFFYPPDKSPAEHLREIAPGLKDIAAMCRELGLQAGFQNHSGNRNVGAPVWDIFSMIHDLDPREIGFCFDIGHATLEGGLSWPIQARLAEPFLTAVMVKDFYWKKEAKGWKDTWCPLGEGMVNRGFFDWLKKTSYSGPICQHHEYPLGKGEEAITQFQHDLKVLKEWLA